MEVKSPHIIRHEKPTVQNVDYLGFDEDGNNHFIQNLEYYYQIQTQLCVSNKKYCDFFVCKSQGYYLERINFNGNFWTKLADGLTNFWKKSIASELLYKSIYSKFCMNSSEQENEKKTRTL